MPAPQEELMSSFQGSSESLYFMGLIGRPPSPSTFMGLGRSFSLAMSYCSLGLSFQGW